MKRLQIPARMRLGTLGMALALAACGGSSGSGDNNAGPTPAPVDPAVAAMSGLLPSDTEVSTTKPLPDSLQSPENLGATSAPGDEQMPPA